MISSVYRNAGVGRGGEGRGREGAARTDIYVIVQWRATAADVW